MPRIHFRLPLSAAIAAAAAAGAFAQSGAEPQRVEVTGSNIRRIANETDSPVQIVGRDEIDKSGKSSVAEFLQTLAIDNQGSVPKSFGGGFAAGASGLSLRGLGAASTLVLLNGRRIAPYPAADDGQKVFVDLNLIPLEGVERVEILKDGASAIYGSDAVAGVVNVILRRDFRGAVGRVAVGQSRYGDGTERRAALTTGVGNLDGDRYNLLLNVELAKIDAIWNRDRAGRGAVGRTDLRDLGFDANTTGGNGGLGGTGAILPGVAGGSAINGNVRNPATAATSQDFYSRGDPTGVGFTRTFAGAACSNFTQHAQGDPGGGCLIDAPQAYSQIQPAQKSLNLFGRGTFAHGGDTQSWVELNWYRSEADTSTTPSAVSGAVGFPGGPVNSANVALGATHPDNPYFGTAARLRYLAADVGPRTSRIEGTFTRAAVGLRGTWDEWAYDGALLFSQSQRSDTRGGFLQRDVAFALLNPDNAALVESARLHSAAFAALPVGSVWRIAENAGLNSPAIYAALSPEVGNDAKSKTYQIDMKVSRDLGRLDGGALGVALGVEARHESVRLDPAAGTDRGNIIGLGYSAYAGWRNVGAVYGELLAPVSKELELSAALRADHYTDAGNSATPRLGAKWTPLKSLALRTSYAHGFRAPSPAENGTGGLAAFTNAVDSVRCALGVPGTCNAAPVSLITSPNPDLKPERSRNATLGLIWEPAAGSNVSADLWQIVRRDEIVVEDPTVAIPAGHVVRDPSTASNVPGDPGAIVAVLARYQNASRTSVRGIDVDASHAFAPGEDLGRVTLGVRWTHLLTWRVEQADGTGFEYVGTHGNCNVTNCIGTPADRVNLSLAWVRGAVDLALALNWRSGLENKAFKDDPNGCASNFADGRPAPEGCRVASFSTVDLTTRWKVSEAFELFGSVQNLFDRVPPLDVQTYGAVSYNPLDYSGAVGRFFRAGVRARF